MPSCAQIDPLVTGYVDGEIGAAERQAVDDHIRRCPPCRSRVVAEQAVRDLCQGRKGELKDAGASGALRAKCASFKRADAGRAARPVGAAEGHGLSAGKRRRIAPLAMAAALVLLAGAAVLYQLTSASNRVMAAELTADHVKCFALNAVLGTRQTPEMVESSMASGFGWNVNLPTSPGGEGLELVGSRPCLYAEGRVAHIMYRHHGQPVSLFMLPKSARNAGLVEVFGHEAAIWSAGNHTFVLIARESQADVERLVEFIRTSVR